MEGNNTSESSCGGGHRRESRVRLSGGGAKPIRIIKVYGPTEEREKNMTPEELGRIRRGLPFLLDQLAVFQDLEFSNGVIEVELAGAPEPGAGEGASGFVGHRLSNAGQEYLR